MEYIFVTTLSGTGAQVLPISMYETSEHIYRNVYRKYHSIEIPNPKDIKIKLSIFYPSWATDGVI